MESPKVQEDNKITWDYLSKSPAAIETNKPSRADLIILQKRRAYLEAQNYLEIQKQRADAQRQNNSLDVVWVFKNGVFSPYH